MLQKIENVGQYLQQHDIKPSYQRLKIFGFLLKNHFHPTVDDIHKNLVDEIPTLSKTTVYNTLKLFTDKEIVRILNIEDNEARYDADISNHGHFKCDACGSIYDIDTDISQFKIANQKQFKIREYHLYLRGMCKKCIN